MARSIPTRGDVRETGKIVLAASADELLVNDDVRKAYLGG
jgi:branched-chain amino acid transport system ATP-binding protein